MQVTSYFYLVTFAIESKPFSLKSEVHLITKAGEYGDKTRLIFGLTSEWQYDAIRFY